MKPKKRFEVVVWEPADGRKNRIFRAYDVTRVHIDGKLCYRKQVIQTMKLSLSATKNKSESRKCFQSFTDDLYLSHPDERVAVHYRGRLVYQPFQNGPRSAPEGDWCCSLYAHHPDWFEP